MNTTQNPTLFKGGTLPNMAEETVELTRKMLEEMRYGVLTTVDINGLPHARWMSSFAFHDFPRFYTLTSPVSRKIEDLQHHSEVNWLFSKNDMSLVLNLIGTASVTTEPAIIKHVWKLVEDKSHSYFLDACLHGAGFMVIETCVKRIECSTPKDYMKVSLDLDTGAFVTCDGQKVGNL